MASNESGLEGNTFVSEGPLMFFWEIRESGNNKHPSHCNYDKWVEVRNNIDLLLSLIGFLDNFFTL